MWAYSSVTMFSAIVAFDDYQQGVISETQWLAVREIFVSYINHPVGRIIWAAQADASEAAGNGAFFESVQERLDEIPPDATQLWFHAMLEEIRALPSERPSTAARTPAPCEPEEYTDARAEPEQHRGLGHGVHLPHHHPARGSPRSDLK
jgi:hypothetical protein